MNGDRLWLIIDAIVVSIDEVADYVRKLPFRPESAKNLTELCNAGGL